MARAERAVGGQQRLANEVQVAHGIQDLVLDELIVVAQAVAVEHLVVVHDDGVVQPTAQGQTVGAHHLHVAGKAKGARTRDVTAVVSKAQVELHALTGGIHGRMVKIDFKAQLVAVVRRKARPLGVRA